MDAEATDGQIRAHLRAGDPMALALIWTAYAEDLFSLLLSMLFSRHDAEDAIQNVFVKIARSRASVAKARDMRLYLLRIARNEGIDLIKRRKRDADFGDEEEAWLVPTDDVSSAQAWSDDLQAALAELPEEQRTVVTMKVYREMTFREIGKLLGISQNTAASRFRYGIEKLRALTGKDT